VQEPELIPEAIVFAGETATYLFGYVPHVLEDAQL